MPIPKRLLAALLIAFGALPLTAQATNLEAMASNAAKPTVEMALSIPSAPVATSPALLGSEAEALAGNLDALSAIAKAYHHGGSAAPDPVKALAYDRMIAEGFANAVPHTEDADRVVAAMLRLAKAYAKGLPEAGLPPRRDLERALLTHGASVFGDPEAQYRLGVRLLSDAEGDARKGRRAARWLLLAARKGHVEAQVALGQHLTRQPSAASRLRGAYWLESAAKRDLTDEGNATLRRVSLTR